MSEQDPTNVPRTFLIGALLSLFWCASTFMFFKFTGTTPQVDFATATSFLFPLIMIWFVIFIAQAFQGMRHEAQSMRDALHQLQERGRNVDSTTLMAQNLEIRHRLDQITELTKRNDTRMSEFAERSMSETGIPITPRETAALPNKHVPTPEDLNQHSLPLTPTNEDNRLPISIPEFIKALNFPDDEHDKEGFRVMRRAIEDHRTAALINSANDLLTMLSDDGIYLDDLKPDRAQIDLWRQFANGKRGHVINAIGGIRDRAALSLAKARLKNDPKFREAAHIFMVQFTNVLEQFEKTSEDSEIHALTDTRSARCFMLLGRVSGTFETAETV